MIIEGELVAGDRVSELGLVDRLQVSRTPLRLALAQLEHEGLLESLPGGVWIGFLAGKAVADVAWYGLEALARRGVTWSAVRVLGS